MRAIVSGLLLGVFTFGSVHWLRNDVLQHGGMAPDGRATGWAIGLGVATSTSSWFLDQGQLIESNVEYNRGIRSKFAEKQLLIQAANDASRREYHGVVRLTTEDR